MNHFLRSRRVLLPRLGFRWRPPYFVTTQATRGQPKIWQRVGLAGEEDAKSDGDSKIDIKGIKGSEGESKKDFKEIKEPVDEGKVFSKA